MSALPIHRTARGIDRAAGRLYGLLVALFTFAVALVLAGAAAWSALAADTVGALVWLLGAVVFGLVSRAAWRSRRGLSEIVD